MVIPGLVVGFLLVLPFLDRGPIARPFSRGRLLLTLTMVAIASGVLVLTVMGLTDRPRSTTRMTGARAPLPDTSS